MTKFLRMFLLSVLVLCSISFLYSCDNGDEPVLYEMEDFDFTKFKEFIESNKSDSDISPTIRSFDEHKMIVVYADIREASWTTPTPSLFIYDMKANEGTQVISSYDRSIIDAKIVGDIVYYIDALFTKKDDDFLVHWRFIRLDPSLGEKEILYSSWTESPFDTPYLYRDNGEIYLLGSDRIFGEFTPIILFISTEHEFNTITDTVLEDSGEKYHIYYQQTAQFINGKLYFLAFDESDNSHLLSMTSNTHNLEVCYEPQEGVNILDFGINGDSTLIYSYNKQSDLYKVEVLSGEEVTLEYERVNYFSTFREFRNGFLSHNAKGEWVYFDENIEEPLFLEEKHETEFPHYYVLDDFRIIVGDGDESFEIKTIDLERGTVDLIIDNEE